MLFIKLRWQKYQKNAAGSYKVINRVFGGGILDVRCWLCNVSLISAFYFPLFDDKTCFLHIFPKIRIRFLDHFGFIKTNFMV